MIKNEIKLFSLKADGFDEIPCTAPCTLYSALMDKGYINNPFFADNMSSVCKTVPKSCTFCADVEISGNALAKQKVYIRLSGIYANAEVFFNGRSYGVAIDPNRVYLFDVTDRVESSGNKLMLVCSSPIEERVPVGLDASVSEKYFMPPYIGDMGIVGKCEVIFTDRAFIGDVSVEQMHREGAVDVSVSIDIVGLSGEVRAVATLVSPSGKLFYGAMSRGVCKITVASPDLWWPSGVGKPALYKLSVTLYEGEEASDTYERRIGLRKIDFDGEDGVQRLLVGGVPVFPMGASYVISDSIIARITKSAAETLIKTAVKSGFNTLRVLSTGVCPPGFFYDLCDAYGIMVYQDIPVLYDPSLATSRNSQNVINSVLDVLAKVSVHPSVVCVVPALVAEKGGAAPSDAAAVSEFFEVFLKMLMPAAEKYLNGIYFAENTSLIDNYDERYAPGHEATLCALPCRESLESFIPEDSMNLLSPITEAHTPGIESVEAMLCEMARVARFPSGIEQTVYATNFAAYYNFSRLIKSARVSGGSVQSAICRQFNDGWPAITPSFVDWYGYEKAIAYAAGKAYAPITVNVDVLSTKVDFTVANSTKKQCDGKLLIALYTYDGKCLFESVRDVSVPAMRCACVASEDFAKYLSGSPLGDFYVLHEFSDITGAIASGIDTFVPPKSLRLIDPGIEASVEGSGRSFMMKLTSRAIALGVCVSFDGVLARFSDNYANVTPIAPLVIKCETDSVMTCEQLIPRLRINTLYDLGKEN